MKEVTVEQAVGTVLAHDLTQIIPGEYKGPKFKKGHIITEDDIPLLLSMGKRHLFVLEKDDNDVHENEAAYRIATKAAGDGIELTDPSEGKIELKAEIDGLFRVDVERLNAINLLDEIMIATRHNNFPVRAGDKLCGTRVIPLIIQDEKLRRAEALAGDTPILELLPYKLKAAGVITTGSEVASGRIQDTFTPILAKKLQAYGITMTEHLTVGDGLEQVAAAIAEMRKNRSTRSSAPAA